MKLIFLKENWNLTKIQKVQADPFVLENLNSYKVSYTIPLGQVVLHLNSTKSLKLYYVKAT